MIRAVIFDFGQTLVDSSIGFRKAEKEAQDRISRDLSITDYNHFKSCYRATREEHHQKSVLSRYKIWQVIYEKYCCQPPYQLLRIMERNYWETVENHTNLFPEASEVLNNLSENDYKLAIITNTQGQKGSFTHRIRRYPEITSFFSTVIVAGEDEIPPKPDAKAFSICLKKLNVAANEAVYVGDDWRNDISGARDAGLHPIWLQHHSVDRNYPDIKEKIPVITFLTDLLPQLEKLQCDNT